MRRHDHVTTPTTGELLAAHRCPRCASALRWASETALVESLPGAEQPNTVEDFRAWRCVTMSCRNFAVAVLAGPEPRDYETDLLDAATGRVVEVPRVTAFDMNDAHGHFRRLLLPDDVKWSGDTRLCRTRLFAFGVVFVVEGDDPTEAIEGTMAALLSDIDTDTVKFQHVTGPHDFRAELYESVEAPVVYAGSTVLLDRSDES